MVTKKKTEKEVVYVHVAKKDGSGWILALWIVLFAPVAIIYYFTRAWGKDKSTYKK